MSSVVKRNHVNIIGNGTKIIMLAHGFGCDQTTWKFITSAFLDDYKLILFDYVGSGNSDISHYDFHKYATLDGYACDVTEIIQQLNLENVIFIGHSVSGMIGMLAAIQNPDAFEKLIFIGPSPKYINSHQYFGGFEKDQVEDLFKFMVADFSGWAQNLAPQVMQNSLKPEFSEFLQESFESMNPKIALAFAKATFNCDYRDSLKLLSVPSVSILATDDFVAPKAVGDYIRRHTPYNFTHMMNATGHYPHISATEETIRTIKYFIEGNEVGSRYLNRSS
ncbi:MAG: alpha/beta hydrolase [Flavobacterium sp.]|nr:MAG: alpha/beta hydrolase [Flavobacterium sp.]